MSVDRPTYRRLLELHALSRNVVLIGAGQTDDRLGLGTERRAAIERQVEDMRHTVQLVEAGHPSLLTAIENDMALLRDTPGAETMLDAVQRIHSEIERQLGIITPPRWTPLGLRQRHRRQLGRGRDRYRS